MHAYIYIYVVYLGRAMRCSCGILRHLQQQSASHSLSFSLSFAILVPSLLFSFILICVIRNFTHTRTLKYRHG